MYLISFLYSVVFVIPSKYFWYLIIVNIENDIPLSVKGLLALMFIATSIFFLYSWLTDPGYISKDPTIDFLSIVPKFNPI